MALLKFDVLKRFSSEIAFTAEIDCDENALNSVKLGLAVKWAVKADANLAGADLPGAKLAGANLVGAKLVGTNLARADLADAKLVGADLADADLADAKLVGANLARADLADANLVGADLADADLAGANLVGADLVDGGQRSDGFRFVGWIKSGELMIRAGCRNLTISEARKHWQKTRGGTALGTETTAILDHIETVARVRGLLGVSQATAA
jgi:uncharacterized protein YjbI with pentapeptide repeats